MYRKASTLPISLSADDFPKFPPLTALFSSCEKKTYLTQKYLPNLSYFYVSPMDIFTFYFLGAIYFGIPKIVWAFVQK